MVLTKTWSAVLAFLAASFLAGMFLLSLGASQAFSRADESGIRAMAQAGVAAIQAEVRASPVRHAASFMRDPRLLRLLGEYDDSKLSSLQSAKLDDGFRRLVNDTLLEEQPNMSVALVANAELILSRTGVSDRAFDEIAQWPEYITALAKDDEVSLSATVAGHLHSIQITRTSGPGKRRLVAIQPIDVSGASSLRQILGTSYRAGFVREGQVIGTPIGGATTAELRKASEGALSKNMVPAAGTSEVFDVGDGADRRLAVVARIPGLRAADNSSTHFVVLTQHTAGFSQKDLAQRLSEATGAGYLGQLNWVLLASLLVLGVALSLYLPHNEVTTPLRRLQAEFDALGRGQQRQIFHDSYTGVYADLARSASAAIQSLRLQWEDEFEIAFDGEADTAAYPREPSGGHRRLGQRADSRSHRVTRRGTTGRRNITRRLKSGAIEVPDAPAELALEGPLEQPDTPRARPEPPSTAAPVETRPEPIEKPLKGHRFEPAPTLTDDVDSGANSLLTSEAYRKPAPDPTPVAPPNPGSASAGTSADAPPQSDDVPTPRPREVTVAAFPAAPPADEREAYFRDIYERFVQTKISCGEAVESVTFEKFAAKLSRNIEDLKKRPDVEDVEFSVYVKDGKAALKAKVVRA